MQSYYASNIAGGAGPITATVGLSGPTSSIFDLFFSEYSGVAAASPLDQTSSGSDTSGTAMNISSKTITKAPSLLYGFGSGDLGHSCTLNSPYTTRETADGRCAGDETVTFTGPFNVTATQSSSR